MTSGPAFDIVHFMKIFWWQGGLHLKPTSYREQADEHEQAEDRAKERAALRKLGEALSELGAGRLEKLVGGGKSYHSDEQAVVIFNES